MKPIMRLVCAVLVFALALPGEVWAQFDQAFGEIVRIREREHMIIMGILIVGGLGFLLAIVANISRAMRKEKKRNRKKVKKRNRAKHRAAFTTEENAPKTTEENAPKTTEESAPKTTEESAPKTEAELVTDKEMIKKIGIALALTIHVPNIIFLDGGTPYPLLLMVDVITWLFVMFFVARAVHRPWREGRIAAAAFFAVGCAVFAFSEPWIGSGKAPGLLIIMWIICTYFTARDINRRVKKAEEEKRIAAEQHAQEPVEQPAQESVEQPAQEEQYARERTKPGGASVLRPQPKGSAMKTMPIMKASALAVATLAFASVWLAVWVIGPPNVPKDWYEALAAMLEHVGVVGLSAAIAVYITIPFIITTLPSLASAYGTYRGVRSWQRKRSAGLANLTCLDTALALLVTALAFFLAVVVLLGSFWLVWGGYLAPLLAVVVLPGIFLLGWGGSTVLAAATVGVLISVTLLTVTALLALGIVYGVMRLRAKGRARLAVILTNVGTAITVFLVGIAIRIGWQTMEGGRMAEGAIALTTTIAAVVALAYANGIYIRVMRLRQKRRASRGPE